MIGATVGKKNWRDWVFDAYMTSQIQRFENIRLLATWFALISVQIILGSFADFLELTGCYNLNFSSTYTLTESLGT